MWRPRRVPLPLQSPVPLQCPVLSQVPVPLQLAAPSPVLPARQAHVPAIVKAKHKGQERREYDAELGDLVSSYHPDWIVLAGWMRVLSMSFLSRFSRRVVNLDPAELRDQVSVNLIAVIECAQADAPRSWKDMKTLPMRREENLDRDENRCCFCHKTASERRRLIAGPPVFVCNECVSVCVDILENNAEHRTGETG